MCIVEVEIVKVVGYICVMFLTIITYFNQQTNRVMNDNSLRWTSPSIIHHIFHISRYVMKSNTSSDKTAHDGACVCQMNNAGSSYSSDSYRNQTGL